MENSSQVGVLTITRSHKKNVKLLSPTEIYKQNKEEARLVLDNSISKLDGEFINIPTLRSYLDSELRTVENSLDQYQSELGKEQNNIFKTNGEMITVKSPSDGET
ncbi:hypothetical protein, partial [Bacteriovorax sp. DB6_IX]